MHKGPAVRSILPTVAKYPSHHDSSSDGTLAVGLLSYFRFLISSLSLPTVDDLLVSPLHMRSKPTHRLSFPDARLQISPINHSHHLTADRKRKREASRVASAMHELRQAYAAAPRP